MQTGYLGPAIRPLRHQRVQCLPIDAKIERANTTEKLLDEPVPTRTKTRIDARHGVGHSRRFATHRLSTGKEDRVLTVEELARQFRVSTKTVSRWRRRGLVSRQFVFDGRVRPGFLQSSVADFVSLNEELVRRGTQFSQMTNAERGEIIARARLLAQSGASPAMVSKRISQETGRNVETVRSLLKQFDLKNPDSAIFPHGYGLPATEAKWNICQQYHRGESVEALAQRFNQPRSGVCRIINEMRAAQIMGLPLDHMGHEQFTRLRSRKKEAEILSPLPEIDLPTKKPRPPKDLPPYLASLYEVPLLTREQEAHLFQKMNYLKYKAGKLRETLNLSKPKRSLMDQIEKRYDESVTTKNQIIRANLRLVVSIAKRYVGPAMDFFELVSDGNISLMRAAEKFDVSRGNKFSTYATWAIMKNFARSIPSTFRHHERFSTSNSEIFSTVEDTRADTYARESAQIQRKSDVQGILTGLDARERQIITSRFGLADGQEALTLKQIGTAIGVSKERVRQIEYRAMSKLRIAAEENRIESPV